MTEALFQAALAAHASGDLGEAERLYGEILAADPKHAVAMSNLGTVYLQNGRSAEGLDALRASLALQPNQPNTLNNLAGGLSQLGRNDEALAAYETAIAMAPRHTESLNNYARLLEGMERLDKAADAWAAAAEVQPAEPGVVYAQAMVLRRLARFPASLAAMRKVVALAPDMPEVHNDLGLILTDLNRHDEAEEAFARSLALRPGYEVALANRGLSRFGARRFAEALADYDAALAVHPSDAEAWVNRGETLMNLGRLDEALASHERALAIDPRNVRAWVRKGDALGWMRRIDDADDAFAQALEIDPANVMPPFQLSFPVLRAGLYEDGWPLYEWRWKGPLKEHQAELPMPLWLGETPVGGRTLLVHSEQGLGDTLMMLRYAPVLAGRGAKVIVSVQAPLEVLSGLVEGVSAVIPQGQPLPPYDMHIPMMSLPLALKTTVRTVPGEPYLRAPEDRRKSWRARLGAGKRPRIGLAWSGNAGQSDDYRRSFDFAELEPLFDLDADLFALQVDYRPGDAERLAASPVRPLGADLNTFGDTAAALEQMNLVITVCTATANLAGGLGRPTFVLVNAMADWRWGAEGPSTPWYPTARIFRQAQVGVWAAVIAEAREAAEAFLKTLG